MSRESLNVHRLQEHNGTKKGRAGGRGVLSRVWSCQAPSLPSLVRHTGREEPPPAI